MEELGAAKNNTESFIRDSEWIFIKLTHWDLKILGESTIVLHTAACKRGLRVLYAYNNK